MKLNTLKKFILITCLSFIGFNLTYATKPNNGEVPFPQTVYTGLQGKHHVQGIAVDKEK